MEFFKEVGRILQSVICLIFGIPIALVVSIFMFIFLFFELLFNIGSIPWNTEYIDSQP